MELSSIPHLYAHNTNFLSRAHLAVFESSLRKILANASEEWHVLDNSNHLIDPSSIHYESFNENAKSSEQQQISSEG